MRESSGVQGKAARKDASAPEDRAESSVEKVRDGLIFDVSEMGQMNVGDLSWLLTASRMARADDVDVWMTGLPGRSWQMLHALGLADEFKQFPEDGDDYSA